MPVKDIIKEIVILLVAAIVCAFVYNAVSSNRIPLFGKWDTSKGVISARPESDLLPHGSEIDDIGLAKVIYDSGAFFVDARSTEDYQEGHIKGALSLPAWDYESHIEAFRNTVPLDAVIVTYCSGRECDDSHELAQRLLAEGYLDVRVLIDGFPAWVEAGDPVE